MSLGAPAYVAPAGVVGMPYQYDFKPSVKVSNETNPNLSQVIWEGAGSLPPGLTFDTSTGVLGGTPTMATPGSPYTVTATYKNNEGKQVVTIVVGAAYFDAVQVALGQYHTCALTTTGGVKCWGRDNYGQLGNDAAFADKMVPVDVQGLTSGVVSISAGSGHVCAVTRDANLKCWGYDGSGQLGDGGSFTNSPVPADVVGLAGKVASVSAGGYHTCAVTTSGGVKCWGYDGQGQLGDDNALANKSIPVDVAGLSSGVITVTSGVTSSHTCALTTEGGVKCWGDDAQGQLGNDSVYAAKQTPVDVVGLTTGVVSIAAGGKKTCALTSAGGVKCWGGAVHGQLGNNNSVNNQPVPVDVLGLTPDVTAIAAGDSFACAVTQGGGAVCWGHDAYGQLGNSDELVSSPVPSPVKGLSSGVQSLSLGATHACAVTTTGLKCWGSDNFGELGDDGAKLLKAIPVPVAP
ncbi:putative Ig domain-containing protein [Nostoc sp. CHAB 5834]|nr:putative Ig domain-containing protein [Nostoc sp. CHAB 5834]